MENNEDYEFENLNSEIKSIEDKTALLANEKTVICNALEDLRNEVKMTLKRIENYSGLGGTDPNIDEINQTEDLKKYLSKIEANVFDSKSKLVDIYSKEERYLDKKKEYCYRRRGEIKWD